MDQVTLVKSEMRARQWASIIKECQSSGQTVTSWCEQHDVHIKSYYYWLRKLRKIEISNAGLPVSKTPDPAAVFKKLPVQTPRATQAAVVIHLSDATLEINEGASQQTVEAVLLALKNIC